MEILLQDFCSIHSFQWKTFFFLSSLRDVIFHIYSQIIHCDGRAVLLNNNNHQNTKLHVSVSQSVSHYLSSTSLWYKTCVTENLNRKPFSQSVTQLCCCEVLTNHHSIIQSVNQCDQKVSIHRLIDSLKKLIRLVGQSEK